MLLRLQPISHVRTPSLPRFQPPPSRCSTVSRRLITVFLLNHAHADNPTSARASIFMTSLVVSACPQPYHRRSAVHGSLLQVPSKRQGMLFASLAPMAECGDRAAQDGKDLLVQSKTRM
jgi:hypothetical protein